MSGTLAPQLRIYILFGLLALRFVAALAIDPIPQDLEYHKFTDTRGLLGIPNFGDVASNAAFAAVGIWALIVLMQILNELLSEFGQRLT